MFRRALRTTAVGVIAITAGLGLTTPAFASTSVSAPRPTSSTTRPTPGQNLTLSGQLNSHVARAVRLQRSTGAAWSNVGRTRTTDDGRYAFATTAPGSVGKARFRVVAPKHDSYAAVVSHVRRIRVVAAPVVSAPVVTPTKDTTPPAVPAGLTATPTFVVTTIIVLGSPFPLPTPATKLSWTADSDSDLAGYTVYKEASTSGPWVRLNSTLLTATTYTDPAQSSASRYAVSATDNSGNESAKSAPVGVVPNNARLR